MTQKSFLNISIIDIVDDLFEKSKEALVVDLDNV